MKGQKKERKGQEKLKRKRNKQKSHDDYDIKEKNTKKGKRGQKTRQMASPGENKLKGGKMRAQTSHVKGTCGWWG